MTEDRSPPADDITLLDVIKHMDSKFQNIDQLFKKVDIRFEQMDKRFEQMDKRFEQIDKRLDQAQSERADILHEVRAQANSCDDTLEKVADLQERVEVIEKQLTTSSN